ncbi:hypothetical protein DSO57_1012995 [Entomophthora muscae]|uniref:Uncharacterized protein n=2 Tax=Entomophthora muscae TaxID=34485 RepID=A0ACC2T908_9FUNG|nr:hypothetical protein DSO57_1000784 [Entomophthora muscae]KAJ9085535.1 hypothetical protein DSO57_1012995 [Entomophthora muscae]
MSFKAIRSIFSIAPRCNLVAAARGYATKSIFVGNLPFGLDRQGLQEHFEAAGPVVGCRLPLDHLGRSRGFGFVEVQEEDFDNFMQRLNNSELKGRQIRLDQASSNDKKF